MTFTDQSSILTPTHRDVLRGRANLTDRGERAAQARIRERVFTGLLDGTLLLGGLHPRERRQIFDKWRDEIEEHESHTIVCRGCDSEFTVEMGQAKTQCPSCETEYVAPWYVESDPRNLSPSRPDRLEKERKRFERALIAWIGFIYLGLRENVEFDAETVVTSGIEHAERHRGNDVVAEVSLTERFDTEELRARFDDRDPALTGAELAHLQRENAVTAAERDQYTEDIAGKLGEGVSWFGARDEVDTEEGE